LLQADFSHRIGCANHLANLWRDNLIGLKGIYEGDVFRQRVQLVL